MERRKFTREFKIEAVKLIQERGVTVAQAARDLGVQGSVLRRWVQESAADAAQAFPGQGQMKPEQAELARCLASTRFEGWRQLEVQGPSSG
jgi:transposase